MVTDVIISAMKFNSFGQIRSLLYVDGFTISGARNKLESEASKPDSKQAAKVTTSDVDIAGLVRELHELKSLLAEK